MSFIRPELAESLRRWREVIAAGLAALGGLWLAAKGGYVLLPAGAVVVVIASGWGITALRRQRFRQPVADPGVVDLDEGQIGYFGPTFGGFVPTADLSEIRLIETMGRRHWRLKTRDGQVLLIPVAASGAERLFDAFSILPGIDMAALSLAVSAPVSIAPVWSRSGLALPEPRGITSNHHENS